jgi:CheY-like chemotaxis protein
VVEDNELNFELASALLETLGYEVSWARDGEDGLNLALSDAFDLVVLDLHLPRLSGTDVLDRLRRDPRRASLPVLVLTADAMIGTDDTVMRAGASAYLSKPFDLGDFKATVHHLLG